MATRYLNNDGDVDLVTSVMDNSGLVFTDGVLSGPQIKVGQFQMSLGKEIELNFDTNPTQTIGNDTSGIHVLGLPELFKIHATAVGSTVTAPNLDTLTDGSDAGSLHIHDAPMTVISQDAEPTLDTNHKMCIWIDTNDTNRVYLMFRRGDADHVKLELV
jgi:hypothetical protein